MTEPLRVLSIFGTRPEAIKMAPVVRALQQRPAEITALSCATAQHRELLDQVLALFDLVPDVDLNIMRPGQTPSQVAARVLLELEPVLQRLRPDWVLVQGDTTTVLAAALAAHHLRIRVGHVEAGLRTGDRWNPFPEESNRVLTDHVSDLCFAPTAQAQAHLLAENIPAARILITGNTVIDALLVVAQRPWTPAPSSPLAALTPTAPLILVTAHRRENFGAPFANICRALREIAARAPHVTLIYPVHPNPNVHDVAHRELAGIPNIILLPPVDYLTLVNLMKRSTLILTDSGGIQEEAPALGVPVLVLRETTERPEAVAAGAARVVGTNAEGIVAETLHLLSDAGDHASMARASNPFGDGHAAERIVQALLVAC